MDESVLLSGFVDRIEEDMAILVVDGKIVEMPLTLLPDELDSGDVIMMEITVEESEEEDEEEDEDEEY